MSYSPNMAFYFLLKMARKEIMITYCKTNDSNRTILTGEIKP